MTIQREAVETLGDRHDDAAAMTALRDIVARHPNTRVRREAEEQIRERRD